MKLAYETRRRVLTDLGATLLVELRPAVGYPPKMKTKIA